MGLASFCFAAHSITSALQLLVLWRSKESHNISATLHRACSRISSCRGTGCLSLFPAMRANASLGMSTFVLGIAISLGAVALEAVADTQMDAFLKTAKQPTGAKTVMSSGVW